jgi:hypothetical protein
MLGQKRILNKRLFVNTVEIGGFPLLADAPTANCNQ